MSIILLLAAQAAGQEITTFYPLPSQKKPEQAEQQAPVPPPGTREQEAAKPAPKSVEPEEMKVLKVRDVPANANVIFVPPPEEPKTPN